jgi:hypothetical protein
VSKTTIRTTAFFLSLLAVASLTAQENSPYSRYGIGDYFYGQHFIHKAMGGLSAAYADGLSNNNSQTINFNNPASYSNFFVTSYDLGLSIDSRTLRSTGATASFNSVNFTPAYVALGVPLSKRKKIGMAFGMRQLSRINYDVQNGQKVGGIDSLITTYKGNGGLNQAFIGVGKRWGKFSAGINTGFNFGRKETNTRKDFVNDTVFYYSSNSQSLISFSAPFVNTGAQYETDISKREDTKAGLTQTIALRLGATFALGQSLSGIQDIRKETIIYDNSGSFSRLDSVLGVAGIRGKIDLPVSYSAGFMLVGRSANSRGLFERWSFGAEYSATQWSNYRSDFEPNDRPFNSWMARVGGQFCPDPVSGRSYWSAVNYRLGFNYGKDYINANGNQLGIWAISMGAGLPIRKWRSYDNQFAIMNTTLEFGRRGNNSSVVRENFFRFALGVSLSDIWFIKRKYD